MRKKFFSLLLLLAAVVTGAVAQEESLLTTLTFGESETYGETTSGVVNVTATNVDSYNGTYGWLLAEGSSMSVTAKEGYTITKCVFHQNAKDPITDTEAPFEIHTNGWGGIIEDPYEEMNGVTSIEVYGYANAGGGSTTTEITVTWNSDFCSNVKACFDSWEGQHVEENNTKDGITVTYTYSSSDAYGWKGGTIDMYYQESILTFTSTVGDISKIEVYYFDNYGSTPNGWTLDATNKKFVWEGTAAAAVDMVGGYVYINPNYIVFTIEPASTPEPEPAGDEITVTWNNPSGYGFEFTQDGVTLTCGEISSIDFYGPGTFTTDLGNFTKIEVTAYSSSINGDGWSGSTWTGNAASVSFSNDIYALTSIVFTIEPASTPEPEPQPATTYTVTFTDINSNVKVVENITLPHTFSCDYTNGNGELDLIIQEFYNEPGGHCATNGWPWGGNNNEVVVGHDGNNHFVTINAPIIGTSFMSGYYDGINAGNFYYTFHINIAAAEPEPQPVTDPITPNVDPQDASVYYSTFYDSNFKYELPTGVEAYVADLSGANLLLTKIAEEGEVIPADNAVILKSTVTPINLTKSDADAVTFTATNDLQGSDTQIATPANCYVLAGTDGVVGFYHYTAANLNAHKAYVVYAGSNQAPKRMPFIFDAATGVDEISQEPKANSQKLIENGVLFIIKNGVKYNAQGQIVK